MSGLSTVTRDEIAAGMKARNMEYISLVKKMSDQFGGLYNLTPSGKLVNWKGSPVGKTVTFEGWLDFVDGKPIRKTWEDGFPCK